VVVRRELGSLGSDTLENVGNERVENGHGLVGDTSVGVDLLEDLVDVRGVGLSALLGALLAALLGRGRGLGGLSRSLGRGGGLRGLRGGSLGSDRRLGGLRESVSVRRAVAATTTTDSGRRAKLQVPSKYLPW
jgi:hypothetical protein